MPQVAQQDYIFIDVPSDKTTTEILTQEQATGLHNRGVLLDVVFRVVDVSTKKTARLLSYEVDSDGQVTSFSYISGDEVIYLEY